MLYYVCLVRGTILPVTCCHGHYNYSKKKTMHIVWGIMVSRTVSSVYVLTVRSEIGYGKIIYFGIESVL